MSAECMHAEPEWRLGMNEQGWGCPACGEKLGYRPDLDRERDQQKIWHIMNALHDVEAIYISNMEHGIHVGRWVSEQVRKTGRYDQGSIIGFIVAAADMDQGDFWAKQADTWLQRKQDAGGVPQVPVAEVMRQAGVPGLFEQT